MTTNSSASRDTAKRSGTRADWPRRAVGWASIAALAAFAVYVLSPVAQVLLVAFAGVLFGIFLDGVARLLCEHTPLGHGVALALVVLSLFGLTAGGVMLLAPVVTAEARTLVDTLPSAVDRLRQTVAQSSIGDAVLGHVPPADQLWSGGQKLLSGATQVVRGVFGAIGALVVIGFVGLFVAADRSVYARSIVRLVPPHRRARWREMLGELRSKLWWWVIGRLVNMAIIGVVMSVGLTLIGVPGALALGVLAGVLTFVPNIGPVLSVIPAVLLALTVSPTTVLWVLGLFGVAQTLESYVITPLVQRRAAAVPPALLLVAQIAFGVPFGAIGLLLATPTVAIAIVMTRMLYVEDRLEADGGTTSR